MTKKIYELSKAERWAAYTKTKREHNASFDVDQRDVPISVSDYGVFHISTRRPIARNE